MSYLSTCDLRYQNSNRKSSPAEKIGREGSSPLKKMLGGISPPLKKIVKL
jgi:hypothetical protein